MVIKIVPQDSGAPAEQRKVREYVRRQGGFRSKVIYVRQNNLTT